MVNDIFKNFRIADSASDGILLFEYILTASNIDRILSEALSRGGDFADIYLEYGVLNGISLEEKKIRQAQSGLSQGIGIRVIHGEKTGYAYSELFEMDEILKAANTASFIAHGSGNDFKTVSAISSKAVFDKSPIKIFPDDVEIKKKAELLWNANNAAFSFDNRIYQVDASIWDGAKIVAVANSEGLLSGDHRVMSRLNVSVYARQGDQKEAGMEGGGGRIGFEYFDSKIPETMAKKAAKQALKLLDARNAPAGPMEVVLGNGWAGILLHEAIGHGLEADFNRKGTSLYSGKIGQKVASEHCTIVDDGTIPNGRGSINIDDEGTPAARNVLIEKGILKGYLHDRLNAGLMKSEPTGSGRRESYQHIPMPRMTNTFMMAGVYSPEEIISSVKHGFYAKSFGGGQVDISNGQFVFQVTEGYMIEDGKISYPVKGANLIGSGPEVLQKVVMAGNNLELDPGLGTCGKDGQSVPVGVGTPTCKISEITVGGTEIGGAD